ncbi:MAG: response regulator [Verrucomicrobiota bacterium]
MTTPSISANRVILAADDDRDDLALLQLLLRKAGVDYPLQLFHRGEDIVAALSKAMEASVNALRPLICFLDVKLPPFDGHEVLRWIRAHSALNNVPVVMLTGSEAPRDVTTAVQHGAQCYLTKYPQPATLREVVSEAERFALGAPADECFRMPTNQLLVRCRRLSDKR